MTLPMYDPVYSNPPKKSIFDVMPPWGNVYHFMPLGGIWYVLLVGPENEAQQDVYGRIWNPDGYVPNDPSNPWKLLTSGGRATSTYYYAK